MDHARDGGKERQKAEGEGEGEAEEAEKEHEGAAGGRGWRRERGGRRGGGGEGEGAGRGGRRARARRLRPPLRLSAHRRPKYLASQCQGDFNNVVLGGFSSSFSFAGSTRESCRWRSCPKEQLLHERFLCAGERLQRYPHPPAHDPAVQLQVRRFNIL